MIDFRYHVVSLISVFLALAVGIVLGAGPLRENLGDQLVGQVEQLRTERDAMRTTNDDLTRRNEQLSSYITATAPDLVAGQLRGRKTVVITDDSSTRASAKAITDLLDEAGAAVPLEVALAAPLWAPDAASARHQAVADLRAKVPALPLNGQDDIQRLSGAVGTLLTASGNRLSGDQREAAWKVLTSAGLVSADGDRRTPVDSAVFASAAPESFVVDSDKPKAASARTQGVIAAQTSLLMSLDSRRAATVLASTTPGENDSQGIIRVARADRQLDGITTTDGLQDAAGPPLTVLALIEQVHGGSGSYGTGSAADARVPDLSSIGIVKEGSTSDGGAG